MLVAFCIVGLHITHVALSVGNERETRIYEALVGSDVKLLLAAMHLFEQRPVYLHAVTFNEMSCSFIVALALYALDLGKELRKERA